ncbi:MAG: hypothetical protein AB1796_13110 [Bacillota bacterium]
MRRQIFLTSILSLLLIGLGFVLGHYYASSGSFLRKGSYVAWTAPSLFWSRVETVEYPPLLTAEIIEVDRWEREAKVELHFPARVGRLHMDKLISGKEAMEHAQRIHGNDAPLVRVFIPYYTSNDEQVTVWIFEIETVFEAKRHMDKINERMAETQDEDKCGSFYLQDVEINYLQSYNMNNYYYRKDNKIYWISLKSPDPIPLFLRFYEHF